MTLYGRPADTGPAHASRTGRPRPVRDRPSPWHWLLAVPVPIVLAVPLYNQTEPQLFGMPLFYWGQAACVPLGIVVTGIVRYSTKRRP